MSQVIDPECSINWHYKEGYIRVIVQVPGMKTQFAGIGKRKLDPSTADVNVSFEGNEVNLEVTLKKGTAAGTIYKKQLQKDDLKDHLVAPEPASYFKVADDELRLYLKTR